MASVFFLLKAIDAYEYHYATVLSDFVSDEVIGKSFKLLKAYGLKVF